tara:strand:+ start:172 stop:324 length:153 start_codon:yes stop_codon:yes gene_type:complete
VESNNDEVVTINVEPKNAPKDCSLKKLATIGYVTFSPFGGSEIKPSSELS